MPIVLELLAVTTVLAFATYWALDAGLRSGDRPGDSRVTVRLGWRQPSDTIGGYAEVRIDNFDHGPVVASASVHPIARWTLPLRSPMSVRAPRSPRRISVALVGANQMDQMVVVDGDGVAGIFEIALPELARTGARRPDAVRVRVTVHQSGTRVRVVTFSLPVPPVPQAGGPEGSRPLGTPAR